MAASAMSGRLTLSDPSIKEIGEASRIHEKFYDALPKLQGEANWQEWSDALQHAALIAGTDTLLNGESKHPNSLDGKQGTTSEWNDNIKRIAIWRARNESLLKAMRGAADIHFGNSVASNAHDTYVSLRSRYRTSGSQQAFNLFSVDLLGEYELEHSPEVIAYELQDAFNQYNRMVGDNIEQRLPENFLKMAFLVSLGPEYHDWRKALLKERDVLALGQESILTFAELVALAVVEHAQLLENQTGETAFPPALPSRQVQKRGISQVDEPAQLGMHRPCSLPHHAYRSHIDQTCQTQNPRLRPTRWNPSKEDQEYLAEHPEIETSQVSDNSLRRSEDDADSRSESDVESTPGDEDTTRHKPSASGQEDASASVQDGSSRERYNNDEHSEYQLTADEARRRFAAARCSEVQSQIDLITQALNEGEKHGKKARKLGPLTGDLSGKWLLYGKEHVSGTADRYVFEVWLRGKKGRKRANAQANAPRYQGRLTIELQGRSEKFDIRSFSPSPHSGRPTTVQFRRPVRQRFTGKFTFWGKGMVTVTLAPSLLDVAGCNSTLVEFAGLQSNFVSNLPGANPQKNTSNFNGSFVAEARAVAPIQPSAHLDHDVRAEAVDEYDRVIRTEPVTRMAVKTEQENSELITDEDNQDSTAMAIKAENITPSVSNDHQWVDDMATTIDTVQRQENLVNQGLTVRLHDIGGEWRFHSPKHYPGLDGRISLSFSIRKDHDIPDQKCAPGHCKPMASHSDRYPRRIYYCGELLLMAEERESDMIRLIRQFDVPKYTSPNHMTILLGERDRDDTICMHTWFLGNGTMRIELPTSMIPSYRGQDAWISFSGLRCG